MSVQLILIFALKTVQTLMGPIPVTVKVAFDSMKMDFNVMVCKKKLLLYANLAYQIQTNN